MNETTSNSTPESAAGEPAADSTASTQRLAGTNGPAEAEAVVAGEVVAGDPATGQSADLPDQVVYAAGADVGTGRFTVVFDLLGRYLLDAERTVLQDFQARNGSVFPSIGFSQESFNLLSGATGIKINAFGRLLVTGNLLFALDDHGVRARVTPLIGLEYGF